MPDLLTLSRRSFILMPLAFAACSSGPRVIKLSGLTMGTSYNLVALDRTAQLNQSDVQTAINSALSEVTQQMSNWDSSSEISRFNAQTGTDSVKISSSLHEVMNAALTVQNLSKGRFDTTIGPLIELWGFGAPGSNPVPSEEKIAGALAASGHDQTLSLGDNTLRKIQPSTQIYLAAIGKGFGADRVGKALESLGLTDYMIEIGGDLYARGKNPDGLPWQVGIETPSAAGGVFEVVSLSGMGLASSGDYRNFFEHNGERFSHLIDPTTGRPVTHKTASATVLAENAMLADAWSTAMLILGREQGLKIAEANGIAVHFIERSDAGSSQPFIKSTSSRYDQLTA